MLKSVQDPNYKKLYSLLRDECEALRLECDHLKDQVLRLSQMVPSGEAGEVVIDENNLAISVPKRVAGWMIEHGLPWQVFKCGTHPERFVTELDSLFPHHMEMCKCDKCQDFD